MTEFEKKICEAFLNRFTGEQSSMRLRAVSVFPEFDSAGHDEKESYLEAAETLEQQGLLKLNWEKKGERLKTITCLSMEKLFAAAGEKDPKACAAEVRAMIKKRLPNLEQISQSKNILFLNYLAEHFSTADVGCGMDLKAAEDFFVLLEFLLKRGFPGSFQEAGNISTRALSIKLFSDSKRLEKILDIAKPILSRARKQGIDAPDFLFLERSFPETLISGKLIFEYRANETGGEEQAPPLVNSTGFILGFPLSSAVKIEKIKTLEPKDAPCVLTVENKETFYALASSRSRYDCFLYTGGYVNRAAAAFIKILSASGFCFYHAGDLDPDGILILQNIQELAEKPVTPVGMDTKTFDRYLPHARPLGETMLRQSAKIDEKTKAIPGIAELLSRILETGKGVEQEVLEYE